MKPKLTTQKWIVTERQFRVLVSKAREFADAIVNLEIGYTETQTDIHIQLNRVMLEGMLIGWLRAQPGWEAYERRCQTHHRRENIWTSAQGEVMRAIQDMLWVPSPSVLLPNFFTWSERNEQGFKKGRVARGRRPVVAQA